MRNVVLDGEKFAGVANLSPSFVVPKSNVW
jgi:hypothetical protein